jgi:hypothetical protein
MKKLLIVSGMLASLIMLLLVSCQQQPSSTESQDDITEIVNNIEEIPELIDESINEESVHLFINKTDFALNELDDHIAEYLSVIDNANIKIESEPRNSIISIKQKVAGIDLRLALLDNENLIGENPFGERPMGSQERERIRPTTYHYPYPYSMPTTSDQIDDVDETTIQDIEEYAIEIHKEIVNELKDLKTEINTFVVASL